MSSPLPSSMAASSSVRVNQLQATVAAWLRSFESRLLLGALVLRLLYLSSIIPSPFFDVPITDEKLYDVWARTIVSGQTFLNYPYYDSPLHAYYLALIYRLFGDDLLVVRLIQAVIGTINVSVLYRIGRRLFDPTTAKVAGILAATYAPFFYYEGLLLKESFALFLLDVAILLLLGALARPTALAYWSVGVVVGVLALSRVNALAVLPAIFIVSWLHGGASRTRVLAVLLGVVMVIAPATIRNRLVSGEWIPITVSGGQVLYTANNPANTTGDLAPVPFVRPNPIFERLDFHRQAEAVAGRRMMPSEVSAYWRQQSLEFMAHYPGTFAHMLGHRLLRFWNALEMPDNHSIEIWKRFSWVLRLPLPGYWLIAPFALVGLALMASRRRHLATLYGTLLLYSLSLLPFWISSRYRLPIVGVLILFAAAAMVEIHRRMREGSSQAGTAPAVGLVLACALVWWPVAPPNLPELERNLAYGYEQTGKYEDAIAIYERLRKTESNPLNDLFLANALGHGGRVEEAAAILKRLSEPDQPADLRHQAHNFWGDLARQAQQWPAAERAYREALKIDPTDFGAWNNLGVALAGQQRLTEALQAFEQAVRHAPDDLLSQRNLSEMQRYLAEHPNPRSK